jgi:hypothetical protein
MPNRSSKRPRDPNQLAKLIADIATGEAELPKTDEGKNPAAVALGRKGGLKGGKERAKRLSAKQLSEIGKAGAKARWGSTSQRGAVASSAKKKRRKALSVDQGEKQ